MAVVSVKAVNFKKLENLDLENINGKSFFVIGDTDEGKTTLLKIILSTLMIEDFPEEPLTTGKDSGFIEAVHELNGMKYTIRRTFTKNKDAKTRFTVTDETGGRHTLSVLLDNIFGKAFTNTYFDYNQYFHQQKSSESRTNYLVNAIGGLTVFENKAKIDTLKRERGKIGTEVTRFTHIIENSSLNPATLEQDMEYYANPKTTDGAIAKKAEILKERKSIVNLSAQLQVVKEGNSAFEISEESLIDIENEISELEKKLALLKEEHSTILTWQKNNPKDTNRQKELEHEISTADQFNREVEAGADAIYNDMLLEVNTHNRMRDELNTAINSFNELKKYQKEWNEKDEDIRRLIAENKKIFSDRLPIPGMTIEEVDDKQIVMYNGREFSYENLSKGKSLRLAMEIQRFLNPKGNNLIVIPEAQSLGSELDEILQECKEHNIQAIVEVTERKQKFQIKFEEDYLK